MVPQDRVPGALVLAVTVCLFLFRALSVELECPEGLLTLVSEPRPGMVGTAGAGQSSLCLFIQPFHMVRAWWSQGNRTGQLASPQFQKEEVGAASPIRPENWHRVTSTLVIGQSSHRPAQLQGEGTQTHLPVGRGAIFNLLPATMLPQR